MESNESRVKRLLGVLSRYAADEVVVSCVAQLMNYDADTLRKDLEAIESVVISVGDAEE